MRSTASASQTWTRPAIENFSASASRATSAEASIIARLIGTSTIVESQIARLGVDAAGAEEEQVRSELAQRALGQHADERAVVAAQQAAGQDQLDVGVADQLVVDGHARRHDGDPSAVQVAGRLQRRRADVDHHRLTVLDERRGGRADAVLGVEPDDDDLVERLLAADLDGAAADALDVALAGERVEVAPHRHLRDAEAARQVGDVHRAGADGPQHLLAPLGGDRVALTRDAHCCSLVSDQTHGPGHVTGAWASRERGAAESPLPAGITGT